MLNKFLFQFIKNTMKKEAFNFIITDQAAKKIEQLTIQFRKTI